MAKATNSLVFFDFETGGLYPQKNAACQIAMVAIKGDTFEKIDLVNEYIKPYGDFTYEPEAMKYTGITMGDLEGGLEIKEVVNQIIALLEKANFTPKNKGSKPILIAHNSAFDKGFLIQIFSYCKKLKDLEILTDGHVDYYGNYQPEMLDTIHFAKLAWGNDEDMSNFKLGSCIVKAGVELNDAHVAINDTIAMKDMVCVLANRMRSNSTPGEVKKENRFRNHFQF